MWQARLSRVGAVGILWLVGCGGSPTEFGEESEELRGSCGVERWSIKTGTDSQARTISLAQPMLTTIAALRALRAPTTLPASSRVAPTEKTFFKLTNVTLSAYKHESDSDDHVVIQNTAGQTMITEFPDPNCVGTTSPWRAMIATARQRFDARFPTATTLQHINVVGSLAGIGFFDFIHGQTGVAPNGIEIHPVLAVCFGMNCVF